MVVRPKSPLFFDVQNYYNTFLLLLVGYGGGGYRSGGGGYGGGGYSGGGGYQGGKNSYIEIIV